MSVKRGDIVLAWYPFASGKGSKRRPCLIVQNEEDNQKLANTVIAQITGNLTRRTDKSHLLIEASSAEGQQQESCTIRLCLATIWPRSSRHALEGRLFRTVVEEAVRSQGLAMRRLWSGASTSTGPRCSGAPRKN